MKLRNEIKNKSWWKDFVIGMLATAVGVGLTFEVNSLVERHNHRQAQRQAAMLAIYDINETIRELRTDRQREDAFFQAAMYLYTHPEELESVSMDTLWMAAEYLTFTPAYTPEWYDDSTEKVFTSGMDILSNLGDITFYDNIQECYMKRRNLLNCIQMSATFKKPITEDFVTEYRKRVATADLNYNGMMSQKAMAGLIREMCRVPEVPLYMQKYLTRDRLFQQLIDDLVNINQENQFIMNISNEDMQRFVERHVNQTMPAKSGMLIGCWSTSHDRQDITYTFRKDRTVTSATDMVWKIGVYVEQEDVNVSILAPLSFSIDGQWTLDGDSLRLSFDPATVEISSFSLDFSSLPKAALERAKDSMAIYQQQYQEAVKQQIQEKTMWAWSTKVSLGKSGHIMFWEEQYTLPWGEVETDKTQLLKSL